MPDARLVSQHAGEHELNRVALTASLKLGGGGIVARYLQAVDRVPLLSLGITRSEGITVDQGGDEYAIRHSLAINLDGAVKPRRWR